MGDVLACLAAGTEYRRLGGLTHRPLILTLLDAGQSESKMPAGVVSGESTLPGLQMA